MNMDEQERIIHWVEKQIDDTLGDDEFNQLQQLVDNSPEARELVLDLMQQHASLRMERVHLLKMGHVAFEDDSDFENDIDPENKKGSSTETSRSSGFRLRLAVISALAASLLLLMWWNVPLNPTPRSDEVIARIVEASDTLWGECSLPTAQGSTLGRGRLKIDRGLATIRFASGAEVTIESPAELEIQSPLAGKLLAGTAVVEVPDSAHGFTLQTPTAFAIDHGTAFAVTVDSVSQESSIEVLDGKVEVQHAASDASVFLQEQQRVVAGVNHLSRSVATTGESALHNLANTLSSQKWSHRITTADGSGDDASIHRGEGDDVLQNSRSELVLVKNPYHGYEQFSRKGYFGFDLSTWTGAEIVSAKFVLTLQPSGLGFASRVGDSSFVVYGLNDENRDEWQGDTLNWKTAPANRDDAAELDPTQVQLLGRFIVRRGVQNGQVSIEGSKLVRFLNSDSNRRVTLIVVRETMEEEPGGLVHGFSNRSSSDGVPPTLLLSGDE